MTNIYLISSIGTSLNKGVPKDFSFFSFLFFWAFLPKRAPLAEAVSPIDGDTPH